MSRDENTERVENLDRLTAEDRTDPYADYRMPFLADRGSATQYARENDSANRHLPSLSLESSGRVAGGCLPDPDHVLENKQEPPKHADGDAIDRLNGPAENRQAGNAAEQRQDGTQPENQLAREPKTLSDYLRATASDLRPQTEQAMQALNDMIQGNRPAHGDNSQAIPRDNQAMQALQQLMQGNNKLENFLSTLGLGAISFDRNAQLGRTADGGAEIQLSNGTIEIRPDGVMITSRPGEKPIIQTPVSSMGIRDGGSEVHTYADGTSVHFHRPGGQDFGVNITVPAGKHSGGAQFHIPSVDRRRDSQNTPRWR